jgi:hypothetical protein
MYQMWTERETEGGNDENGPKRCQTRRLGHRYVFLKNFFVCYDTEVVFYAYTGREMDGREMEGVDDEKGSKRHIFRRLGGLGHRYMFFYILFVYLILEYVVLLI